MLSWNHISDDVLWSCYNTSVASVGLSLALVSFIITFNRHSLVLVGDKLTKHTGALQRWAVNRMHLKVVGYSRYL